MKLSNQEIIDAYNSLVEIKHPDPLGFIARGDVLTQLDKAKRTSKFQGPLAVNLKKAKGLLFEDKDIRNPDRAVEIQSLIDSSSYADANQNLKDMYRLSFAGGKNAFNSFYRRLENKRKRLEKTFKLGDDGLLESIGNQKSEKSDDVAVTKVDRRPVIEGSNAKTADDLKQIPFTPSRLDEDIEKRIRIVIRTLMKEVAL